MYSHNMLQQCLPLAVLKLRLRYGLYSPILELVATVLTACGIETSSFSTLSSVLMMVATVLTACGIETIQNGFCYKAISVHVATVLTACGIETLPSLTITDVAPIATLQQCLPLAVLKPFSTGRTSRVINPVATVLTACGIETTTADSLSAAFFMLQQCLPLAVLKPNEYSRINNS